MYESVWLYNSDCKSVNHEVTNNYVHFSKKLSKRLNKTKITLQTKKKGQVTTTNLQTNFCKLII